MISAENYNNYLKETHMVTDAFTGSELLSTRMHVYLEYSKKKKNRDWTRHLYYRQVLV